MSVRPTLLSCTAMFLAKAAAMDARCELIISGDDMPSRYISTAVALGLALLALTACGNTIRGLGRDMGNAVDATQDAGRSVVNSVK